MLARCTFLSAVASLAGLAGAARADYVIDGYYKPATATSQSFTPPTSGVGTTSFGSPFTTTLGNGLMRTLTAQSIYSPPPNTPPGAATLTVGGGSVGVLDVSTPTNTTASVTAAYTNLAAGGISNLTALGATAIQLQVVKSDLNVPFTITAKSASGTSTYSGSFSGATTITAALSSFTGNANFSALTELDFAFNKSPSTGLPATTSADFTIDNLKIKAPNSVPAPPALALALMALPALGFWRRKRADAAAV